MVLIRASALRKTKLPRKQDTTLKDRVYDFENIEVMPEYPGGIAKFYEYVMLDSIKNLFIL